MEQQQHRRREGLPVGEIVRGIIHGMQEPPAPSWPDFASPAQLKSRLIRAICTIQRYRPGALHVSRAQLRHLITLVSCTDRKDLAASGGMLGASNDWYAGKMSVRPETVTGIFRALKQADLIEPKNATANNRRSCHLKPDGQRDGRGYTLRPLVARLGELEALATELEEQSLLFAAKRFEVKNVIAEAATMIEQALCPALAQRMAQMKRSLRALRAGCPIEKLTNLLREALGLLAKAKSALAKQCKTHVEKRSETEKKRDQTRKKSRQHHTDKQSTIVSVKARQEPRSRNGDPGASSVAKAERLAQKREASGVPAADTLSCGITVAEGRKLFPDAMQYIPANEDHEECVVAASRLGQVLNINPRLLGRAFEAMGIMRTLWALHLVRQRLADGQIQLGAGPYFNGMVAKARKGELDIDRSIWGLRANIA